MGDPRFPKKKYQSPLHPWQGERIKEEVELVKKYGLVNKKEIWRMLSIIRNWRTRARKIVALRGKERTDAEKLLISNIQEIGILDKDAGLDQVLGLDSRAVMEKRLQTTLFKMGLAASVKQARQFITHNKVLVNGRIMNAPSYLVKVKDKVGLIAGFKAPAVINREVVADKETMGKPVEVVHTAEGTKIQEVPEEIDLEGVVN